MARRALERKNPQKIRMGSEPWPAFLSHCMADDFQGIGHDYQARDERLFTAALELDDQAQRGAFLDAACSQDPQLRAEVELLLKHDDEAGSFIECPAVAARGTIDYPPITEGPGTLIGPYKLLQRSAKGASASFTWPSRLSRSAERWP
jgi:hypothetical protein